MEKKLIKLSFAIYLLPLIIWICKSSIITKNVIFVYLVFMVFIILGICQLFIPSKEYIKISFLLPVASSFVLFLIYSIYQEHGWWIAFICYALTWVLLYVEQKIEYKKYEN